MQITENKSFSRTNQSVRLSKTSKSKIAPTVQQDYLLQLSNGFSLRINRVQYDSLLIEKFAVVHKDKKLNKENNKVTRLLVIKLNPSLYGKCHGYYNSDKQLQLEVLPEYRNYVDKNTAKALRSFFTLLLKLAPYRD